MIQVGTRQGANGSDVPPKCSILPLESGQESSPARNQARLGYSVVAEVADGLRLEKSKDNSSRQYNIA